MVKVLRQWLDNLKLIKKMLFIYLVFGILPMLLIAVYAYSHMKDFFREREKDGIFAEMKLSAMGIQEQFRAYYWMVDYISRDAALLDALKEEPGKVTGRMEQLAASVEQLGTEMYGVSLYVPSDMTGLRESDRIRMVPDPEKLLEEEQEDEPTGIFHRIIAEGEETGCVKLHKVLPGPEQGKNCVLEMTVSAELWKNFLETVNPVPTQVITDKEGVILGDISGKWSGRDVMEVYDSSKMIGCQGEVWPVGYIYSLISISELEAQLLSPARYVFVITLLLSATVFFGFYMGMNTLIRKRLELLKERICQAESGSLAEQEFTFGKDEIGEIEKAVNQIAVILEDKNREVFQKDAQLKAAELELLQEQIQPHFLYNSLSMISAMGYEEGHVREAELMQSLAEFYRISLNQGEKVLTIGQELELTKEYLKLQKARFGEMIRIEYQVDPSVLEYRILKMTLQPVLENSIRHGRGDGCESLELCISIFENGDRVAFEIADSGIGMKEEQLSALRQGIRGEGQTERRGYGIYNICRRLRNYYGEDCEFNIESEYGLGTRILFQIPKVS